MNNFLKQFFSQLISPNFPPAIFRHIHITSVNQKFDIRRLVQAMPKLDEGVQTLEVESYEFNGVCDLPDPNLLTREYDGVKFQDLPRITVVFTKNNTKLTLWQGDFATIYKSCRTEGFENSKKSTTVAASAATMAMAKAAKMKGIKNVRLCIRGLGPGRMACLQTFAKSDLNFVSISDFSDFRAVLPLRPRKQRRV